MRSVLFTTVLVLIGLIAAVYIAVSIPSVQKSIKQRAEHELSAFLGGRVSISEVDIRPFNELRLYGVSIYDPDGKRCISVGRLGAGISLWSLISSGTVEIAYAELISLNAEIIQQSPDAPLNIDFIIKALSPKDKKQPPAAFRVKLRNVVIRKSALSFDRDYIPQSDEKDRIDFNHLELNNLRADIALPLLTNDDFTIDLRRLAFDERSGLKVGSITALAHITPSLISVSGLSITLDDTKISVSDQNLKIFGFNDIVNSLKHNSHSVRLVAKPLVPSEFSAFYPRLSQFNDHCSLVIDASGDLDGLLVEEFRFTDLARPTDVNLEAVVSDLTAPGRVSGNVKKLEVTADKSLVDDVVNLFANVDDKIKKIVNAIGNVSLFADGSFDLSAKSADIVADISTDAGHLSADAVLKWSDSRHVSSKFSVNGEDIDICHLTDNNKLGLLAFDTQGEFSFTNGDFNCNVEASVPYVDYNAARLENISLKAVKDGPEVSGDISVDNSYMSLTADANCILAGESSIWSLNTDISKLYPAVMGVGSFKPSDSLSGILNASITGNSIDSFAGTVSFKDVDVNAAKKLHVDELLVVADVDEDNRTYAISSELVSGSITGYFKPTGVVDLMKGLVAQVLPTFVTASPVKRIENMHVDYDFVINPDDDLYSTLKIPVRPGTPVTLSGHISGNSASADLHLNAPYLIQGRDKLIKNTSLSVVLSDSVPADVRLETIYPLKNDMARLSVAVNSLDDHSDAALSWVMQGNSENKGNIGLEVDLKRSPVDRKVDISALIKDSEFILNGARWNISPATVDYTSRNLTVNNLRVFNRAQFIDIKGNASDNPLDVLAVELAGIDLKYIFDILNINYVDFGGIATGRAHVSNLFSKAPVATTDTLFVKDLSYNDCVLGDGNLDSHWDNDDKMVAINADIKASDDAWATVRGGVYVTRDSLSFDFNTEKIDVGFLRPFVSGFTSSISGKATGHVSLFGTFSDIDLVGKAYADSVTMLVDYTNVYYSGSDTIYFDPGRISIPSMKLYDRYGNSCMLNGEVTHNFLHDAKFNFEVTDVRRMLVYDTGPKMNPLWYGRVFANGYASIRGVPGLVSVNLNMSTTKDSRFTLVLDENETALNYTFLTFSDKKKEAMEQLMVEESFEDKMRKKIEKDIVTRPDLFVLDLALDVTPGATMVIVMDPKAGDKITANGSGALQMHYDSDSDDFSIYGKYTLARGVYNFSLQELILKNFNIREGSGISFNGDPLRGNLDITAAYRVNTNLADLDESFKSDPDLNRTSVPVDALLKVTGEIDAPEINFDLSLPTVTSDVERRVRSIISTDDMMNRQVIYLLALNRFYSPEYMSAQQGGELASVASSTLSSQIQNIIGSLTDKFTLAPSFKSEKDDFSDMEVDVALSSRLFDNRLLINGNLGYRDRSTSQTTFIGDFDIEYLLSRDGKLRLKAYNHFNDASYYLKSALTTQGIGIVYRKDFDDPLSFIKRLLRRKKKNSASDELKKK